MLLSSQGFRNVWNKGGRMTWGRLLSEASAPELPLLVVVCGGDARPTVVTWSPYSGRSFFMGHARQQMDIPSLQLMSEAIKSLKGQPAQNIPKTALVRFSLSKAVGIYEKWCNKSGPGGLIQQMKEKVLLGNPRSCHRCGCPSLHLPDPLATLGIVVFGHQTIDLP